MLRGQLQSAEVRGKKNTFKESYLERGSVQSKPIPTDVPSSSHLSQCGFALEEICVLAALWRVEFGVEESAAVSDGLQGGGTLVGEGEPHKQLQRRENKID